MFQAVPKFVAEMGIVNGYGACGGKCPPAPPVFLAAPAPRLPLTMACAPLSVQVGAGDLDGFQADTEEEEEDEEEDEEEEGGCVVADISDVGGEKGPKHSSFRLN